MKNISQKLKNRGNILAMTLIVGGIAGVTAVSISAMVLSDVKISGQREDSLLAYQAASAGVDLGLMYYKYNNNVQLSDSCENTNDPANCTDPTSLTGLPIRIYIDRLGCTDTGKPEDIHDLTPSHLQCAGIKVNDTITYEAAPQDPAQNLPANERVLDLKIWYKDDHIGNGYETTGDPDHPLKFDKNYQRPGQFNSNYNYDPSVSRVVKQDDDYQIDGLEKVNTFRLYLRPEEWAVGRDQFMQTYPGKKPEDTGVFNLALYHDWFQNVFCNGQIQQPIDPALNIPNNDWCMYYTILVPPQGNNYKLGLREPFKPINVNGRLITLDNNPASIKVNSVRIRPINMDMQFAINNVKDYFGNPLNIDTGITHIEVTGYFGGAKRVLEAQLDRKTNAFLGIFDRALYVGEGDLAP